MLNPQSTVASFVRLASFAAALAAGSIGCSAGADGRSDEDVVVTPSDSTHAKDLYLCATSQLADTATPCSGNPASYVSIVANGDSTATMHTSSSAQWCQMDYWTDDGQSGSFAVPVGFDSTAGCGAGAHYQLTCGGLVYNGYVIPYGPVSSSATCY